MKGKNLPERLYLAAGLLALAGVGLVFSMVFAGAGVVLLVLAAAMLLIGLLMQLLEPQITALLAIMKRAARAAGRLHLRGRAAPTLRS